MSRRATILQSTILLTLANFAMRGVTMAFQVYLTGQVGAAGIGLLQLILTVNGFALTLGTSGIRVAAMYLSAEEYGLNRKHGIRQAMVWCLGSGLLLSTAVGGLMAFLAEPLALYWVKDLRAAASLRLLGLTLPLTCLSSILAGYFTACGKIGRLVTVEVLDRLASAGLTMWLLRLGVPGDLSHACVSIIGGGALASLGAVAVLFAMLWLDLRRVVPSSEDLHMGKRLARFCVPVALNDYLRSGLGTLEQFLIPYGLSRSGGSRDRALADYGTIHGMVFPVILFPNTVLFAVADLLVPRLARCTARRDHRRAADLVTRSLRAGVVYAAAIGGLVFLLAQPLGLLLYDSADAARYLRWFAPLIPMLYLDCIVDGIHKGLGQQIYCVRVNTLTNLLDVVFLFLLLPRFGIGGYFFTYTFTHAINFYLSIRKLLALTDVRPSLRFPAAVAGAVCAVTVFLCLFLPAATDWSGVLVRGGLYLTMVGLLLTLTGAVDKGCKVA